MRKQVLIISGILFLGWPIFAQIVGLPDSLRQKIDQSTGLKKLEAFEKATVWANENMTAEATKIADEGLFFWKKSGLSDSFAILKGVQLMYHKGFGAFEMNDLESAIRTADRLDSLLNAPSTPPKIRLKQANRVFYIRGLVASKQHEPQKALDFFLKMEKSMILAGYKNLTLPWVAQASEYGFLKMVDSAVICSERAFQYYQKTNDTMSQSGTLLNRGEILIKNGRVGEARVVYHRAAELARAIGHPLLGFCLSGEIDALRAEKKFAEAFALLPEAEEMAEKTGDPDTKATILEVKAPLLAELGRFKEAYEAQIEYQKAVDIMSAATHNKGLAELQMRYETAEKEREIVELSAENRIKTLRFWLVLALSGLIGLASFLIFRWFLRQKRRTEAALRTENVALQKRFDALLNLHFSEKRPSENADPQELFLSNLLAEMEKNLANESFSVDDLPQLMGMSRTSFFKKIKEASGKTPAAMLREIRLQKGRRMLESNAVGVSETAFAVGFSSGDSFSRAFREFFGKSPSDVRKTIQNTQNGG
jgi:AraC-like DNA-binding protein